MTQKTYTAVYGKDHSPLITLLAPNGVQARAKIIAQLSMPGRQDILAKWRKACSPMCTQDGLILYYSEELASLVTIPQDELVTPPVLPHVPEGMTEDEALVIKAFKAVFRDDGWQDKNRHTTYKNLTVALWQLKHIEKYAMKQLVKDVVSKGYMAWRGVEKIHLTQAGIWAAEQL